MMITLESDVWNVSLCQGLETLRQNELFCDVTIRACNNKTYCCLNEKRSQKDSSNNDVINAKNSELRNKFCAKGSGLPHNISQAKKSQHNHTTFKNKNSLRRSGRTRLSRKLKTSLKTDKIYNSYLTVTDNASAMTCECATLKAHSVVLGASSAVLQETLKQSDIAHYSGESMKIIHFRDVSSLLWKVVLKFIYLGVVTVKENLIYDLGNVASKLQLTDLLQAILSSSVKTENILHIGHCTDSEKHREQCQNRIEKNSKFCGDETSDQLQGKDALQQNVRNESGGDTQSISRDYKSAPTEGEVKGIQAVVSKKYVSGLVGTRPLHHKKMDSSHNAKVAKLTEESVAQGLCIKSLMEAENEADLDRLELIDTVEGIPLTRNIKDEKSETQLKSKDCDVHLTTEQSYGQHQNGDASDEPAVCPVCGKRFKNRISMRTHQLVIHTAKCSLTCDQCSKRFYRKQDLTVHERTHTGEKPYGCSLCTQRFSQKQNMKLHEKTHLNEKNFECDTCGKTFLRKWGLQEHEKTHTGDKPFLCQTCGKSFSKISNLQVHERIHSGLKPYSCLHCALTFSDPSTLRQHMVVHQNNKAHQCTTCGLQFARAKALKEHERIHTGEKPHKCDECGAAFAYTSNLTRHRKCHQRKDKRKTSGTVMVADCEIKSSVKTDLDSSAFLKTPNLSDFSFSKLTLGVGGSETLNTTRHLAINQVGLENEQSSVAASGNLIVRSNKEVPAPNSGEIVQHDTSQPVICDNFDKNIIILGNSDLKGTDINSYQDQFDANLLGSAHNLLNYSNLTYSFPNNGLCFQIAGGNVI